MPPTAVPAAAISRRLSETSSAASFTICLSATAENGALTRPILIALASARSSDGARVRRNWLTLHDLLKEFTAAVFHRGDNQGTVKKVILLFTMYAPEQY